MTCGEHALQRPSLQKSPANMKKPSGRRPDGFGKLLVGNFLLRAALAGRNPGFHLAKVLLLRHTRLLELSDEFVLTGTLS